MENMSLNAGKRDEWAFTAELIADERHVCMELERKATTVRRTNVNK